MLWCDHLAAFCLFFVYSSGGIADFDLFSRSPHPECDLQGGSLAKGQSEWCLVSSEAFRACCELVFAGGKARDHSQTKLVRDSGPDRSRIQIASRNSCMGKDTARGIGNGQAQRCELLGEGGCDSCC